MEAGLSRATTTTQFHLAQVGKEELSEEGIIELEDQAKQGREQRTDRSIGILTFLFSQQFCTSPVDKMSSPEEHNHHEQQEEYPSIHLLPSFSQGYSFDDGEGGGHHPHTHRVMFHPEAFFNDSPTSSTNAEGEEQQQVKEEEGEIATPRTQPASHIRPRQASHNQEGHQLLIPNLSSIGSFPPIASSLVVHPRPSPNANNPVSTHSQQQQSPSLQLLQPQHSIAYTHSYPSSSSSRMNIPIQPHTPFPLQHQTSIAALSSTVTPMQSAQQQQRPAILIAPSQPRQQQQQRRRAQGPVWAGRAWTKANVSCLILLPAFVYLVRRQVVII